MPDDTFTAALKQAIDDRRAGNNGAIKAWVTEHFGVINDAIKAGVPWAEIHRIAEKNGLPPYADGGPPLNFKMFRYYVKQAQWNGTGGAFPVQAGSRQAEARRKNGVAGPPRAPS